VVVLVDHLVASLGFSELEVGGALGLDHIEGHAQADGAVNGAASAGDLVVRVLNGDFVAEEPCRARSGVGDQRFLLGQFQVEFFTQERRQTDLDFLCFGLGSGEPEEVVIALCGPPDYAECGGEGAGQRGLVRSGARHNLGRMSEVSFVGAHVQSRKQR
jgi:hypothetical protein